MAKLKNFTIKVEQPLVGTYEGEITLMAKNKKDFLDKLQKLSQKEIENLAVDWTQSDNYFPNGDIQLKLDSVIED